MTLSILHSREQKRTRWKVLILGGSSRTSDNEKFASLSRDTGSAARRGEGTLCDCGEKPPKRGQSSSSQAEGPPASRGTKALEMLSGPARSIRLTKGSSCDGNGAARHSCRISRKSPAATAAIRSKSILGRSLAAKIWDSCSKRIGCQKWSAS